MVRFSPVDNWCISLTVVAGLASIIEIWVEDELLLVLS